MWNKNLRQTLINLIYLLEFNEYSLEDYFSLDWERLSLAFSFQIISEDVLKENIDKVIKTYFENREEIQASVESNLEAVYKTNLLTKAVIYTFLTEQKLNPEFEALAKTIINNYLKITQEFVGKESTSVLHALMNKYTKTEAKEVATEEVEEV
jgi:transcription termination factor NusB